MTSPALISTHPLWPRLQERARAMPTLQTLFTNDPQRFIHFSAHACDLLFDYSKQRIEAAALADLLSLAHACGIEQKRAALFSGAEINHSEHRAALHTALRASFSEQKIYVHGENIIPQIQHVLQRMTALSAQVHQGQWLGFSGKPIRHIVNLGIGGSDLGPAMVCQALSDYAQPGISVHFVSNVDGSQLADVLAQVTAEQTLFIITSKSFTTLETMLNARSARAWMLQQGCPEAALGQHFIAASANLPAAQAFGIHAENIFPLWDWVGGRYSLWGSVGLAIILCIGGAHFAALLAGAQAMDTHFSSAPLEKNLPVLLALVGIWNINFFDCHTRSIAPYHQRLARFPAYLQQLEMESTGKSVTQDGQPVDYATCPIIFGEPGTNGQHAYFQLLHQGTQIVPTDFIAVADNDNGLAEPQASEHHIMLLTNCLAQSQALAFGSATLSTTAADSVADAMQRACPGDRPSNTLLLRRLTPATLGSLIALYEHKVFVQAMVWHLNPFDQWGVELGKTLAVPLRERLQAPWHEGRPPSPTAATPHTDTSTTGLVAQLRAWRCERA